ncbi:MAG: DUF2971 domain-containing protein [Sulfuricurvum sp.]
MREIHVGFNNNLRVICDEHKHIGNLPCPWPKCKNGILEDEFIDSTLKGSKEIKGQIMHYKRCKWESLDGQERFSWDNQNFPTYYFADKILREENLRTGLEETDYSNYQVYHYTNIQGLQGIIDSEALWMTDFQYMNDSQEINHGIQLAESILRELKSSERYIGKEDYLKIWEKFVETGVDRRICISCFSLDNGDSLSQWRGYADKGAGISIGFNVSEWKFWNKDLTRLDKVIYDIEQQRKILLNLFHIHLTLLDWNSDKNITNFKGEKIEPKKPEELTNYFISQVYKYIISFKHHSFEDEKEARWVYLEDMNFLEDMSLKSPKKQFRTAGNKLIPYISSNELPNILGYGEKEVKMKLPITEIVVGPQKDSDLVVSGIKELLQEYGYSHVNVRKSKVPFRSH